MGKCFLHFNLLATALTICCIAAFGCARDFTNEDTRGERDGLSELMQSVLENSTEDERKGLTELMQSVLEDSTEEERVAYFVSKESIKAFLANDAYTGIAGNFIGGGLNVITAFATMDFTQKPAALAKAIGDALVPIIALGLALVPGVGPIISGVFTGLWGLFSGLFGGGEKESQESRLEKMVNEAIKKSELKTDAKLQKLLTGSIHGEITRNKYICDKYAIVAGNFSQNYKRVEKVNDTYRLEMIMYLDNCDNFLKDTAEAFNHPDFAEVLWVPSAMTTLTRIGFLSDVITYGHALRISETILKNFYRELKEDIKRHYTLHAQGILQRLKNIEDYGGLSGEEMTACKMQSQLLYLDRGLYPYGIPKRYTVQGSIMSEPVPESIFKMEKDADGNLKNYTHIQIFADATDKRIYVGYEKKTIINCYMGLTLQKLNIYEFYMEKVNFKPGYSYTIRVLYFTKLIIQDTGGSTSVVKPSENKVKGEVKVYEGNKIEVNIREEPDKSNRAVLFNADATYIFADRCKVLPINEKDESEPCLRYKTEFGKIGHFVIDEVGTLNILGNYGGGSFRVTSPKNPEVWFVGVEFIVRNVVPEVKKG